MSIRSIHRILIHTTICIYQMFILSVLLQIIAWTFVEEYYLALGIHYQTSSTAQASITQGLM